MTVAAATCKQELARLSASLPEILVDGLPRLLGPLEPDRAIGLLPGAPLLDQASNRRPPRHRRAPLRHRRRHSLLSIARSA